MIALFIWPAVLWQLVSFHLGSVDAINQLKASQVNFTQVEQFCNNAEPVVSGLVALGFINYGWIWAGVYVSLGTLVALAYEKSARTV